MKTCLNCEYEPKWSTWRGYKYKRCIGICQYLVKLPPLPKIYRIHIDKIVRYDDDSGVLVNCPVWQKKQSD